MNLRTDVKALLRPEVRLSQYTTMHVGGPARYFSEPETEEELLELLEFGRQENLPVWILGKGSNTIFPDEGYPGLVIALIHFEQNKIDFDMDSPRVTASGGIFLYRLALACREHRMGGVEFLANIPGTLGGALMMNAGYSRFPGQMNQIGDVVESMVVLEAGKRRILQRQDFEFSYRRSSLAGKIILEATLRLWYRTREQIENEIRANFEYRNRKQDLTKPSSGSIFKNPGAGSPTAGQLIDRLGLKGLRVGGAMVSEKHANYFINAGEARSADFSALVQQVQKTVFDATGIQLETEVCFVPKP